MERRSEKTIRWARLVPSRVSYVGAARTYSKIQGAGEGSRLHRADECELLVARLRRASRVDPGLWVVREVQ